MKYTKIVKSQLTKEQGVELKNFYINLETDYRK